MRKSLLFAGCLASTAAVACSSAPVDPGPVVTVDASVTQAPKQEQGQANSAATGSQSSGGTSLSSLLGLNKARITSAKVGAGAVRQAAELYVATSAEAGRCPQPQDLVAAKLLDPPSAADPWGHAFRIVCEDSDVRVHSNGRDGIDNTADDVRDDATPSDLERIGDL